MMTVSIQPAMVEHAEGIAEVHVRSWRETYGGLMPQSILDNLSVSDRVSMWKASLIKNDPEEKIVVASEENQPIGFISVAPSRTPDLASSEVTCIYLLKQYQGLGLGRKLMEAGMNFLRERQHADMMLWALSGNRAEGFYEAMGGNLCRTSSYDMQGTILTKNAYKWFLKPG